MAKLDGYLIQSIYKDEIVGHVIKDSTPVEAREKKVKKNKEPKKPKKNGRPRKGEVREKEKPRIERQRTMSLSEMLNDLPKDCDMGMKQSPKGYTMVWKGYKLHSAVDDHCIPLAAIVTSASLHDSQAAIPLATKADRVCKNFYDLMDAAYNAEGILEHSRSLNHVPIVGAWSKNSEAKAEKEEEERRRKILNFQPAEEIRYTERAKAERVYALFKDNYGGSTVRVRGHLKVACHVMFGILTLTGSLLLGMAG